MPSAFAVSLLILSCTFPFVKNFFHFLANFFCFLSQALPSRTARLYYHLPPHLSSTFFAFLQSFLTLPVLVSKAISPPKIWHPIETAIGSLCRIFPYFSVACVYQADTVFWHEICTFSVSCATGPVQTEPVTPYPGFLITPDEATEPSDQCPLQKVQRLMPAMPAQNAIRGSHPQNRDSAAQNRTPPRC